MSTKNIYQFFNKVAESEELQYRLDEGGEIDAEALIALGAEYGYEIDADVLQFEVEYFFDTKSVEQVDLKDTYELKLTYIPKNEYVRGVARGDGSFIHRLKRVYHGEKAAFIQE